MSSYRPRAAASKRKRAEVWLGYDEHGSLPPYEWLADQYMRSTGDKRERLALELLPYDKPKLKAIDLTQRQDVKVTITIGGKDADS